MLAATHSLIGATIGAKIKNVYWAFLLGILSHFIFDAIPHWSFSTFELPLAAMEFGAGLLFIFLIMHRRFGKDIKIAPVLAGTIGAVIPDLITLLIYYFFPKYLSSYFSIFHHNIQTELSFWFGFFPQIFVFIICSYIILKLPKKIKL